MRLLQSTTPFAPRRFHAIPRDPSKLIKTDLPVFKYLLVQTASEFVAGEACVDCTEPETLALGALLLRHYHAAAAAAAALDAAILQPQPKLDSLTPWIAIDKTVGLHAFFPDRLRSKYPVSPAKRPAFLKAILKAMLPFSNAVSATDCKMRLAELLRNLNPDFGVHTLGSPPTGTIGASGIVLYADDGFTAKAEVGLNNIADCSFGGGKSISIVRNVEGGGTEQLLATFGSSSNAGYFFATCELYRALASQRFHKSSTDGGEEDNRGDTFWEVLPTKPDPLVYHGGDGEAGVDDVGGDGDDVFPDMSSIRISSDGAGESGEIELETEVVWEIDLKDLEFTDDDDILGHGQFGKVLPGVWRGGADGKEHACAIKTLKEVESDNAEQKKARRDEFLEEAHLMKGFDHPGIMMMYGVAERAGLPYLVMELMPLGELRAFVRTNQRVLRPKSGIAIGYVVQIAAGIQYLHARDIIHRDLAARNILVRDPKTVKVADFGLSKQCKGVYAEPGGKMPLRWMAPESCLKEEHSSKSDVWMFGVCSWEILSYGVKPFNRLKPKEYVKELKRGTRLEKPRGCPKAVYDVLLSCWEYDPTKRPMFDAIIAPIKGVLDKFAKQGMADLSDADWKRLGGGARDEVPPNPVKLPRRPSQSMNSPRSKSTPPQALSGRRSDGTRQAPGSLLSNSTGQLPDRSRRGSLRKPGNPFTKSPVLDRKGGVAKPIASRSGASASSASSGPRGKTITDEALMLRSPKARSTSEPIDLAVLPDLAALGIIGLGNDNDGGSGGGGGGGDGARPDLSHLGIIGLDSARASPPALSPTHANFDSDDSDSQEEDEEDDDDDGSPQEDDGSGNDAAAASAAHNNSDEDGTEDEQDEADARSNEAWEQVDLTRGARSQTCIWYAPSGEFEWPIQAALPLAASVQKEERLDERIRTVVDRVLVLKESQAVTAGLADGMAPGDFRDLVLQIGQDYHGVVDEIRILLENASAGSAADKLYRQRVENACQHLGTLFVLVLESLAEVAVNFGFDELGDARKEVVSCCSKFAIGCMHLSNAASQGRSRGGSKSFAHFSSKRRHTANRATYNSQLRVSMHELAVPNE